MSGVQFISPIDISRSGLCDSGTVNNASNAREENQDGWMPGGSANVWRIHTYSAVYVPTAEDDAVKEYIRMRDDENNTLKRIKQQTITLCTRHGKQYNGKSYWTKRHLDWLRSLDFGNGVLNEVLREYLVLYYQAQEKVDIYCKQHGISEKTYYYWLQKLRRLVMKQATPQIMELEVERKERAEELYCMSDIAGQN